MNIGCVVEPVPTSYGEDSRLSALRTHSETVSLAPSEVRAGSEFAIVWVVELVFWHPGDSGHVRFGH